jgi:hypothetical protein
MQGSSSHPRSDDRRPAVGEAINKKHRESLIILHALCRGRGNLDSPHLFLTYLSYFGKEKLK